MANREISFQLSNIFLLLYHIDMMYMWDYDHQV